MAVNNQPNAKYDPGKTYVVKGDLLNRLAQAALPVKAGKGLKEFETAKGKIISLDYSVDPPPFAPLVKAVVTDGLASWQVSLTPGCVIERKITGDNALIWHDPTDLVDGEQPFWHTITDGQALYVRVKIKKTGKVDDAALPVVMVESDTVAGAHYRAEAFAYVGADGTHWYKMFQFTLVSGQPKLRLYGAGSHIDHEPTRMTWKNRTGTGGDIRPIGDTYDPTTDTMWLKALKQLTAVGVFPIIKPLTGGDTPESVQLHEIYAISAREEDPQINMTVRANSIEIHGNGIDGDNASVVVKDGLVSEVITDPSGWWGSISLLFYPAGGGGSGENLITQIQNGRITSVSLNGTSIPGTEGTPGDAELEVNF